MMTQNDKDYDKMIELDTQKCCKKFMRLKNSYVFIGEEGAGTYFSFQCEVCGKVKEVDEYGD